MFDYFKRKKRTKAALGIVWPLIYLYCVDETGKVVEKLESDGKALAYIYGVLCFTISKMNIKSVSESGLILLKAFEHIFPGRGHMMLTFCVVRLESDQDTSFRKNSMAVFSELEPIFNVSSQGEAALEQILNNYGPSLLQKHLMKHYR